MLALKEKKISKKVCSSKDRVRDLLEFFTNSRQYMNINFSNFILAVPLQMNQTNEFCNLEFMFTDI